MPEILNLYLIDVIKNKYADFEGRATRSEYWYFTLFTSLISILLAVFDALIQMPIFQIVFALAVMVPSIAITVRRLHDTNRSGWWMLIGLIPIIGALVLLFFLVQDTKEEEEI